MTIVMMNSLAQMFPRKNLTTSIMIQMSTFSMFRADNMLMMNTEMTITQKKVDKVVNIWNKWVVRLTSNLPDPANIILRIVKRNTRTDLIMVAQIHYQRILAILIHIRARNSFKRLEAVIRFWIIFIRNHLKQLLKGSISSEHHADI